MKILTNAAKKLKNLIKEEVHFFDAEDFMICFTICNQPRKTQLFALSSLLQGCSPSGYDSSYICVMPKEDLFLGGRKHTRV